MAEVLRNFLQGKPAGTPVWPGTWMEKAAVVLRRDLATARRTWLESCQDTRQRAEAQQRDFLTYCDAEGRYADFHALRHTYISRIVQSGASAKTAQTLARHSTVQLTLGRYAHATLLDLASAVGALPPIDPVGPQAERQVLRATGTDGRAAGDKQGSKNLSPNLVPQPAISGHFLRLAEMEEGERDDGRVPPKMSEKQGIPDDSTGDKRNGPARIRTENQGIMRPLL